MADTAKRNTTATTTTPSGKVATPRAGGSSSPAFGGEMTTGGLDTLAKAIGARVKLTTVLGQSYEGTLFTACPILNVVALNTRSPPPNPSSNAAALPGDYHVIPISKLQAFHILALDTEGDFARAQPPIARVDVRALKQREAERVAQLHEEYKNRGKGVSREGQALFDSFKRINMEVHWHEQSIVVAQSAIISPPYGVEDCKGPSSKQEVINRVKKILEGERRKIKEREEKERRAATTTGPRKGG